VKVDKAPRSQLHALSAYHFTFWIHALKEGREAAPMCACDFSIEKSDYYLHIQKCIHIYIFQFIFTPFSIKYFVKHCLNDDISLEESLAILAKNLPKW
jgi:hypothetical protein